MPEDQNKGLVKPEEGRERGRAKANTRCRSPFCALFIYFQHCFVSNLFDENILPVGCTPHELEVGQSRRKGIFHAQVAKGPHKVVAVFQLQFGELYNRPAGLNGVV